MAENPDVALTLDDAVQEVLGNLTGLDLNYQPEYDRYRAITRQLNRALRANALEQEWSHYHILENVGTSHAGDRLLTLRAAIRPRAIGDDAIRLVNDDGQPLVWAYILPRDALHKYANRPGGLWASIINRETIEFSRGLYDSEAGYTILVPAMREPRMFRLPEANEILDPDDVTAQDPPTEVSDDIRQQTVDFDYPDVIILRAACYVAMSDPVMQPRVQTLEAQYKDLTYGLIERDTRNTDAPFLNEFFVPITNSIDGNGSYTWSGRHPHSDERY